MAESVMRHYIKQNCLNWETDSAGLRSWNVGRQPEERCLQVLAENGLSSEHTGREIRKEDFHSFDYIFGMDTSNIQEINEISDRIDPYNKSKAKIELLGRYIGRKEDEIIQDPYFSNGICAFRSVYAQINESCRNFVEQHKSNT